MANSYANTVAAASTAVVKPLSYVSLCSHDGKRIILPLAAAAGSRVLHGIFQGLYVMQLHQSTSPTDQPAQVRREQEGMSDEDARHVELHSPRPSGSGSSRSDSAANAAHSRAEERVRDPIPIIEDEDDSEEADVSHPASGAAYRSYAAVFPSNVTCVPPSPPTQASASPPAPPSPYVPPLLNVPIRSLESSTLVRVAEFLVVKITLASHPNYLHEADIFGDLDRTSERDQLVAMQVLLGADLLNC
ncbi:hypothetical protein LSCM1_07482 [Leishmania martiniquensis]|uniref:Uncharacterized protein n=1 Tax=Leishmania martiniquensis TaxID=1580590 RepID=A0A836I366_9TRYP|nr:hypothetical protein LSCM1_07482 [Leishmania martiniquensis]